MLGYKLVIQDPLDRLTSNSMVGMYFLIEGKLSTVTGLRLNTFHSLVLEGM